MLVVNRKHFLTFLLCLLLTLAVVSCGDEEEPTPTPAPPTTAPTVAPTDTIAPPTDTPAPTATPEKAEVAAAAEQPESPLAQESPLPTPAAAVQPPSPLAVAPPSITCVTTADSSAGNGQIAVLADPTIIEGLVQNLKPPTPTKGNGAIGGLLYSYSEERVIPGTQFYLTKGLEDGDNVLPPAIFLGPKDDKGDVAGFTDSCGQLFVDNVPPGKYYLAIWTVYDWLLAFDKREDKSPLMIEVKEGDQLNLGRLEADWP